MCDIDTAPPDRQTVCYWCCFGLIVITCGAGKSVEWQDDDTHHVSVYPCCCHLWRFILFTVWPVFIICADKHTKHSHLECLNRVEGDSEESADSKQMSVGLDKAMEKKYY